MGTNTPITCTWGYTWTPTGIVGGYEIEFHTNAFANAKFFYINAFDLKQTPGATCLGTAPPCFQYVTGPIEIPDVVTDLQRNERFAQLIGLGWAAGINPGNKGFIETTQGYAYSTTQFIATWPFSVSPRCDVWDTSQKAGLSCPPPRVYFQTSAIPDYIFNIAGGTTFAATALAVNNIGSKSLQILATTSGMTAGASGHVTWGTAGTANSNLILIDSSVIGD
jgi:hypothetical protein